MAVAGCWRIHQSLRRLGRSIFGIAALLGLAALVSCLDDTPVAASAPTVRASLRAAIAPSLAGGTVRIRVGYRTRQQQFVVLPSSPEEIGLTPGSTVAVPVTVHIGPCLVDENRVLPSEKGCVLTVELTLTDANDRIIDTQTRDARAPAMPGDAIDFGTVTIGVVVSTITVAPTSLGMTVADERTLTATVLDANGAVTKSAAVSWTTSDASVASVASVIAGDNGTVRVRALKLGSASVTASAGSKTSSPVTVTVSPPAPLAIKQRQGPGCVIVGQSINLDVDSPPGPVMWTSGNNSVATVSATGVVTGVATGQAVITATSGNRTGTATVCVTGDLRISNTDISVVAGKTAQIATNGVTGAVSYVSDSPAIATVSESGLVTGVAVGQATATATLTAASGSSSVPVRITVTAAALVIRPSSASASVNGIARFSAQPLDANGTTLPAVPVSWSIADPSIGSLSTSSGATIDVRALKLGTTTVRATLGTVSASAQFTATAPLPAARLEKVSGDGSACPTRSTGCTFVVRAIDVNGVAVPGASVSWSSSLACGPAKVVATDAGGLSSMVNLCSSVPAGSYTQSAALVINQAQVSFTFALRGLVLTLEQIDSFGAYVYSVTSPGGTATGLSVAVEYVSGRAADYVSQLDLTKTTTPSQLTVGFGQSELPFGDYVFDVIVSTTTPGIGPGVDRITLTFGSGFVGARPNERTRLVHPVGGGAAARVP